MIERWTRAYIMEMFSCWLFSDSSGNTVHACMLEWLRDLDDPPQMNWGAMVLACLYRDLCTACRVEKQNIYGPVALLQHWSWTRFPFGHPQPRVPSWAPTGVNRTGRPVLRMLKDSARERLLLMLHTASLQEFSFSEISLSR